MIMKGGTVLDSVKMHACMFEYGSNGILIETCRDQEPKGVWLLNSWINLN